ncbi:hypothetical protein [Vibrio phage VCPH]|nr:hypothetical protein [Vibrio phage VCPH]
MVSSDVVCVVRVDKRYAMVHGEWTTEDVLFETDKVFDRLGVGVGTLIREAQAYAAEMNKHCGDLTEYRIFMEAR